MHKTEVHQWIDYDYGNVYVLNVGFSAIRNNISKIRLSQCIFQVGHIASQTRTEIALNASCQALLNPYEAEDDNFQDCITGD